LARCLIIGCGCRGRALARELMTSGHAVRGTTRHSSEVAELTAAGIDAHVGDPDRVSTLAPAFEHVTVACVLLGSAGGSAEQQAALHGPRLEMMLTRMLDTTIRGVVYESTGTVGAELLAGGAERVRAACEDSRISFALLDDDPAAHAAWLQAATTAVHGVIGRG
jgi:nucleoside-diphosphate-sugar epimerase